MTRLKKIVIANVSAGLLFGSVVLAAGQGGAHHPAAAPAPASHVTTLRQAAAECARFAHNVDAYDILQPGASRAEYLQLLRMLRQDCPAAARAVGLEP